ncbi:MAG: hypothetical protein EOP22_01300 [Hyphomicrobiales bacterium]|nr:MAG: hypothetical protein EOP22_01300 [Hyphomicrobiales bacterium]
MSSIVFGKAMRVMRPGEDTVRPPAEPVVRTLGVDVAMLALIALLVVVTQLGSMPREIIDWDETTFMLMAQDMLRGHLPYTEAFDNKPPLTFVGAAVAMLLFGESLETMRWFGDLCIFASAACIYLATKQSAGIAVAGAAAAAFVAAHVSEFGMHTSSEVIANVGVAAALALLITRRNHWLTAWLVGVLISLAVLSRSNLAFVAVAIGIFYATRLLSAQPRRYDVLKYVLGGLIIPILLFGVYAFHGSLNELLLATVRVPLSYAAEQGSVLTTLSTLGERGLRAGRFGGAEIWYIYLSGACLMLALVPFKGHGGLNRQLALPAAVLIAIAASIVLGGAFFQHYLIQFYVPLAMLTALSVGTVPWKGDAYRMGAVAVITLALAGSLPATIAYIRGETPALPVRAAADLIAKDRLPGETIWGPEAHLALFYLREPPLSRAGVHPSTLVKPAIMRPLEEAGYVVADELGRIMRSKPTYILTGRDGVVSFLWKDTAKQFADLIAADYERISPSGYPEVYRHKAAAP